MNLNYLKNYMGIYMGKAVIITCIPIKKSFEKEFWETFVRSLVRKKYTVYLLNDIPLNCGESFVFLPRNLDSINVPKSFNEKMGVEYFDTDLNIYLYREILFMKCKSLKGKISIQYILYIIYNILKKHTIVSIITWGELSPASYLSRWLIKKTRINIPLYEAERAPFDEYIWIEKDGIFEQSKLWKKSIPPIDNKYVKLGNIELEKLKNNVYGFRKDKNYNDSVNCLKSSNNLAFLPMDNVYETGWMPRNLNQTTMEHMNLGEPFAFIEKLQQACESLDYSLSVRKHPSCKYILNDNRFELKDEILKSKICFCNYTKVAFPIIALNKPLITFVKNPVLLTGKALYLDDLSKLNSFYIEEAEKLSLKSEDAVSNSLGWMLSECFYTNDENEEHLQVENLVDLITEGELL